MVLVSVILPSYNHEKYISQSIENILSQTFKDFELIIIDDKSPDKCLIIAEEYKKKDDRIKIIQHEKNEGISKSVNDGINFATGKFLAISCTDDIWKEDKLEKQLDVLKKNENIIVWNEADLINKNGECIGRTFTQMHDATHKKKSDNIFNDLLTRNYICFSSIIFKRKILGNTRFDENYSVLLDYKLEVDLAKMFNYYFIDEPLTKFRIHKEAAIHSNLKRHQLEALSVRKYFLYKYENEISRQKKQFLYSRIINLYLIVGNRKKAAFYIFKSFKNKPYYLLNLFNIFKLIFLRIYYLIRIKIIKNLPFIKKNLLTGR